jgi:acyl-CoA synthetase (AMP-forming)/AMP-acid ligase II
VVDDHDEDVPRGTEGELVVRWGGVGGPHHGFFSGYLKNSRATDEAWRGGWFHTGDVVRQMPHDTLVFVDRRKNIIRRSGENIAAAEVEATLQTHDDVGQVAVLSVPDELRDEEVMACVLTMPGVARDRATAERLVRWCLDRLAYFKSPGWVLFVESLPTTSTQKVQKAQIFPAGALFHTDGTVVPLRVRLTLGVVMFPHGAPTSPSRKARYSRTVAAPGPNRPRRPTPPCSATKGDSGARIVSTR